MASHDENVSPPSKRKAPAEGAKSKKSKKMRAIFQTLLKKKLIQNVLRLKP
eukprot:UN21693